MATSGNKRGRGYAEFMRRKMQGSQQAKIKSLQEGIARTKAEGGIESIPSTLEQRIDLMKTQGQTVDPKLQEIAQGARFGADVLGEGLERLGPSEQLQQIVQQRQELAKGLTAKETQAARDVATENIQQATETQRRALAALQARTGVRGATAAQQQSQVLGEGAQRQAQFERQLLLGQREAQQQGLAGLESTLGQVEARRRFDIGQAAAEKQAILSAGLGFAQLGSAERGATAAAQAQVQAAQAQQQKQGLFGRIFGGLF